VESALPSALIEGGFIGVDHDADGDEVVRMDHSSCSIYVVFGQTNVSRWTEADRSIQRPAKGTKSTNRCDYDESPSETRDKQGRHVVFTEVSTYGE
jgi:hypothetical protein